MAASNKKRKLATGDQETDSAEIGKPTSSSKGSAAASSSSSSSSSSPSSREIAAFSLESVQASARSATAAALTDASAADVDSMLADAQVHFLTPDKVSWVYHVPRWYRFIRAALAAGGGCSTESDAQWFEEIWRLHPAEHDTIMMFGRAVPTPRFQQAYGESYRFSGNTFIALPVPEPLRACVETLQAVVADAASGRSYLRGALVNWYADGEHYIGPHSDGEASLLRHSPVLSLSLGAARRFVFTAKKDRPEGSVERLELLLQDGDLVVMGGTTQQTHKHALPKMKRCLKKRVSVTMRCFK